MNQVQAQLAPVCKKLTTGAVPFTLEVHAGAEPVAEALINVFNGVFPEYTGSAPPTLRFSLHPADDFDPTLIASATKPFALRRSSALPFNLDLLLSLDDGTGVVAYDPKTLTGYIVNRNQASIAFYVTNDSLFHLVETLRYTLLMAEQNRSTLILHASAAQTDQGDLMLVLGDKGRGKTTTLLSMVLRDKLRYFSGDKVLADIVDGALRLRAWPDYAHVGIGTFSLFPDFARACGISLTDDNGQPRPNGEKHLVAPDRFAHALDAVPERQASCVSHVILPDVTAEGPLIRDLPLTTLPGRFDGILEDARQFTPGCWHQLTENKAPVAADVIFAALSDARWVEVLGRDVPLSELLDAAEA
ncbi:MAG: hypothetical protein GQ535_03525 [Rhodobacteraceae bacterium]|nr:hypothetical protein [Paracoccaceae bacterium]